MSQSIRLNWFAAPSRFYALSGFLLPWLWLTAIGFAVAGLYIGFFVAPTDATQGDAYRIIFVHVPAAWMSMLLYLVMAGWAVFGWAANARLASMVARALAPTGAMFTFLALWTGAVWGKPTWGTWWVWDARLTSELILLFLYLGFMAWAYSFAVVFMRTRAIILERERQAQWVKDLAAKEAK
jgi:heme exporter protein C